MKSRIKNKKSPRILSAVLALLLLAIIGWIYIANSSIGITRYQVHSPHIPDPFDHFIIAQVSDLHNKKFGENQEKLMAALQEASPDIIVITGDLIDSRKTDVAVAMDFIRQATFMAPVYYATGNHESRIPEEYAKLESQMIEAGVQVLRDHQAFIEVHPSIKSKESKESKKSKESKESKEQRLQIIGLEDPDFYWYVDGQDAGSAISEKLNRLMEEDSYTILLSHRPELMEAYTEAGVNLALTGHAHGGQFRIPLIGGIAAPDQGFFPKYSEGMFQQDATTMVVSRGLGNSIFPFRFNNSPELVVVTLKKEG